MTRGGSTMTDRWDDLDRAAAECPAHVLSMADRTRQRAFVALASPDRIRELIARVRRLETLQAHHVSQECHPGAEYPALCTAANAALGDDR